MGKIIAVCRSRKKGTSKEVIEEGYVYQNYGLAEDAHADSSSHRQVSLIAQESIDKMSNLGLEVGPGSFAENLTTEGINLAAMPLGTEIRIGEEVILEITQIGKECHTRCAIYHKVGQCIMPEEGIFTRVIRGGTVRTGDDIGTGEDGE